MNGNASSRFTDVEFISRKIFHCTLILFDIYIFFAAQLSIEFNRQIGKQLGTAGFWLNVFRFLFYCVKKRLTTRKMQRKCTVCVRVFPRKTVRLFTDWSNRHTGDSAGSLWSTNLTKKTTTKPIESATSTHIHWCTGITVGIRCSLCRDVSFVRYWCCLMYTRTKNVFSCFVAKSICGVLSFHQLKTKAGRAHGTWSQRLAFTLRDNTRLTRIQAIVRFGAATDVCCCRARVFLFVWNAFGDDDVRRLVVAVTVCLRRLALFRCAFCFHSIDAATASESIEAYAREWRLRENCVEREWNKSRYSM